MLKHLRQWFHHRFEDGRSLRVQPPLIQRRWRSILSLVLVFVTTTYLYLPLQPPAEANLLTDIIKRVTTLLSPQRGTAPTGRRSGGAGRGPLCPASLGVSVKALVFSQTETEQSQESAPAEYVWGKTVEAQPTLWFYVPYKPDAQKVARLVLLDEAKQIVSGYPITLPLTDTPGLMAVRLPSPLKVGRLYNWYFSIVCSTEKPSRNPGVRGWIQRVETPPALAVTLNSGTSTPSYSIYAENGIWYDLVTTLLDARRRNPQDQTIQADWLGLLDYVNIPELKDNAP